MLLFWQQKPFATWLHELVVLRGAHTERQAAASRWASDWISLEYIVMLPWLLKISSPPHFEASQCIPMRYDLMLTLTLTLPLDARCVYTLKGWISSCILTTGIHFWIYWKLLLLPANEVWGKVILSEACVKNSVHGEGHAWLLGGGHTCVVAGGGVWMVAGGCVVAGGCAWLQGHAWLRGGMHGCGGACIGYDEILSMSGWRVVRILMECILVVVYLWDVTDFQKNPTNFGLILSETRDNACHSWMIF